MKPRPAAAMKGHAFALSWQSQRQDRKDARAMCVYARLKQAVTTRARMMILSGLAGGRP